MTTLTVHIPIDAAALSLGAERVAAAFRQEAVSRGIALEIKRTGSHGMFWLEPLVEVETLQAASVSGRSGRTTWPRCLSRRPRRRRHPLSVGHVGDIVWMVRQQRLTFARCGVVDPLSLEDYARTGRPAGA